MAILDTRTKTRSGTDRADQDSTENSEESSSRRHETCVLSVLNDPSEPQTDKPQMQPVRIDDIYSHISLDAASISTHIALKTWLSGSSKALPYMNPVSWRSRTSDLPPAEAAASVMASTSSWLSRDSAVRRRRSHAHRRSRLRREGLEKSCVQQLEGDGVRPTIEAAF